MSDTAKQLLLAQGQLQRSIVRSVDNLKKLGRANVTPAILRSRISTIKENWALFFRGHSELLRSVSEDVQQNIPYFKDGHYDLVEDAYQSALDYMNESLETLEPPAVSLNQTSSDAGFSRSNFSLSHLPPTSLPPFDGTLNAWEHFRDRFNALIIQNRDLKDFARMHYLVSCLTGSALECVRDLAVTADNFENAWQALNLRFENKRRLVRSHLSTLLNLPTVSKESAGELQALIDKVNSTIASLKKLDRRPKDLWNDILVYIVSQRLDAPSRKSWSMRISDSDDLPSFSELLEFLQHRRRALDDLSVPPARVSAAKALPHRISASTASSTSASGSGHPAASVAPPASSLHASSNAGPSSRCPICQAKHYFNACPSFVKGSLSQRRSFVQSHKRCFNCLGGNHSSRECPSKYTCRHCHQKHHTLLHDGASAGSGSSSSSQVSAVSDAAKSDEPHAEVTSLVASRSPPRGATPVLLATAWISVIGPSGRELRVRALIDQGSEMTFVSESITNVLRLKRVRCPVTVSAVGGQSAGTYQFASSLSISPVGLQSVSIQVLALILPKLTSYSPRCATDLSSLSHLHGLKFADENPTGGEPINVILGADVYNEIILSGLKRGAPGQLIAQNSIFGWILSGPIESRDSNARCASHHVRIAAHHAFAQDNDAIDLADALERFWKCEEPPERHATSVEDEHCESHFLNTYSRNSDGRFVVRLPFKNPPPLDIGTSRARALHCINSLLRRFRSTPEQSAAYRAFMSEYAALGHMRLAPSVDPRAVFIPHHPVFRPDSATSRIRVVFNASSRTSNGSSLNDHLYAGPKLQSDLPTVILRWRIFRFVCTADIAKMYRQILVNESDVDFQRILWQPDPSDEIREFQLLTVTYGTACAPFLALRVLKQLSHEDGRDSPLAQHILNHHIYVDDVLFGADDTEQLVEKRNQLVTLLRRGCFTLRKWASNSPLLLSDIDPEDHGLACSPIPVADEHLKVLGIHWMPFADEFRFRVTVSDTLPRTKRSILSVIAKLYDPIGWVTPTIICAKIIIQRLWKLKISWDDPVPPLIMSRWEKVYSSFSCLNSLQIPRWIGFSAASNFIELHGFADASSEAYAAVVYSRVISTSGEITVSLLMGKSKVAPLKLLSIPRLELCAAVLLAKLLEFVTSLFTDYTVKSTCWTDSSIVLAWLRHSPSHWKTFVANRVADIQARIPGVDWRHVVTGIILPIARRVASREPRC
ncbi:uncharacterized protein [Cardiocondyla obscurior]|uniref:uncharacterized protein n=1 Tax=Cardiocondyla obscurior TaxID=286306 RepID=UPI00396571AB